MTIDKKIVRTLVAAVAMLCLAMPTQAQWRIQGKGDAPDTLVLPKFEPHLSMGTGVIFNSWGDNRAYYHVAPNFTFRPNERWTINAGFGFMTDMWSNYNLSSTPRSLAPYKHQGEGTRVYRGSIAASYHVSENVWLAAAITHLGGTYAPIYGSAYCNTMGVSATAISAAAAFRFSNDNFLHLSFTFIRDHSGSMPFLMRDAWHGGYGMGAYGLGCGAYASAFDLYRIAGPYNPAYGAFGGWNCW